MSIENHYLTLTCPNRPGIVAAVSTYIFELGGDIEEAQQFDDKASKRFFMRVSFSCNTDAQTLKTGFVSIAKRFDLTWDLRAVKDLGFNRSTQQIEQNVLPVFDSLVFF
jgi:formyltetrahydrofolate deformylase